jgi:hypothetical protein
MRNRFLVVAFLALVLSGCPSGGFFGRYIVVNNTGSTLTYLSISVGKGTEITWDETLPGQGWMHPEAMGPEFLIVSWTDETGSHEEQFSFEEKINYRSEADLYVELNQNGKLAWRVIEPPHADGSTAEVLSVMVLYVFFCLAVSFLVGVPLGLTVALAYGLFTAIRTSIDAAGPGFCGGRSFFQFTIREIMLLTTVAALAFGWLVRSCLG